MVSRASEGMILPEDLIMGVERNKEERALAPGALTSQKRESRSSL